MARSEVQAGRVETRRVPRAVLEQLREIDPRADLIYGGDGVWILGVVNPNALVTASAYRHLERELRKPEAQQHPRRIAVLRRVLDDGFRIVAAYELGPERDFGRIVEDFRERDFNYRNRREAAFEEALERSDVHGDRYVQRIRTVRDFVAAEARSIWRHAIRGARGFLGLGGFLKPGAG